jgi:BlaI family transcriptional regulator, penicillinase repressor
MAKRPPVAKSELEVARIVWELGEASVRQVLDALPPDRGLDFKTVQTYLRRLEAKGYLRTKTEGRTKIYLPRVRPQQVVREVIDDLLQLLFRGESLPLFQHLIQERGLSENEFEQLRAMLDQMESQES